ncbi:FliO/MopB family protein [Microbacterium sp. 179-I 3D2 NHS]|uniref:FliO/MopB family protein n=1 Tax=Microbacterium sp. 179-I 3D2 NHS TaxID=3235178 RepID=UPI0039A26F8C
MLGLLWFLQRRVAGKAARRRENDAITVLGRQSLGMKAQLVVVQTDDHRYVLGVTEHGVAVVDRLPLPRTAAPDDPLPSLPAIGDPGATEFDRIVAASVLAESDAAPLRRTRSAEAPRLRERHRNDPLRGSILSPDTWRQTAEVIRRAR